MSTSPLMPNKAFNYSPADADDVSFLGGKTIMLTGCTNGIGQGLLRNITALDEDERPLKIIIAARSKERGEGMQKEVLAANVQCDLVLGDFSQPRDVARVAEEVIAANKELHVLVSNVGIFLSHNKERVIYNVPGTDVELEAHFAVNYLSMVLLVKHLMPLLERSAPARVCITGSFTSWEMIKGVTDLSDLQFDKRHVTKLQGNTYANSKLLQHMWVKHYAAKVAPKGVTVNVCCPGMVMTNIGIWAFFKQKFGCCFGCLNKCLGSRDTVQGSKTLLHLAGAMAMEGKSGLYLDWGKTKLKKVTPVAMEVYPTYGHKIAPHTADAEKCEMLYNQTEDIIKRVFSNA